MLRILIILFALNAFAPPAMAVDCDMMHEMDMSSMSHDMTEHNMLGHEMSCEMDQDNPCSSVQCITGCAANFPLPSLDDNKSFVIDLFGKLLKDNLLSLYEIVLPVNTPPPLV